jgi:hypothetical protein
MRIDVLKEGQVEIYNIYVELPLGIGEFAKVCHSKKII